MRRLNNAGYTETYMKDVPSGGQARKYYHVTQEGKDYVEVMQKEWELLIEKVKLLGIR